MIEVFRYNLSDTPGDDAIVSPCMATRAYVEACQGKIVKGSGRFVDESLLGGGRVVQGFTGEQISYLRELVSLGPIATGADCRKRPWLSQLTESRLIRLTQAGGSTEYAITPLGRAAVAQLF
jgi:hypothetical protein